MSASNVVPKNHPRYKSLMARHLLEVGVEKKVTSLAGLVAHGRGEAFDYMLGERTRVFAKKAAKAAAAQLLLARQPIISVNGNTTMLVPEEMISLGESLAANLEINLFYDAPGRRQAIAKHLRKFGLKTLFGIKPDARLKGLTSQRGKVDSRGMYTADVVLVMLEDGDRTEILRKNSKRVVAIDLSPFSRTAKRADITIVDNVIRALPIIEAYIESLSGKSEKCLQNVVDSYDNREVLREAEQALRKSSFR